MIRKIKYWFTLLSAAIFFLFSCKKETSCEGCKENNKPPIAVAGPDQLISLPTDSISLDGSASNDPDETISEWLWKKIDGPASLMIVNPNDSVTLVKNLAAGTYRFELTVKDDEGLSAKDTVQIIVDAIPTTNHPPVANAGADTAITLPASTANLNGSASADPDNNITTYQWTKVSGPASFNITSANAEQTQVTNLVEGVYQFELKVTDAGGLFSRDTVQIIIRIELNCPTFNGCDIRNPPDIQGTSTQIGTLSVPRMPTAAAAGNKVVFAGGLTNFHCGTDGWYFTSASSAVDIYDRVNNSWSTAQLSIPRGGIRSVSCGNKIFFAGGEDGISVTYDNVDIYDVSTNTWSVAHLSQPRAYITTATVGNKVFFVGGYFDAVNPSPSTQWGVSNTVDIYDLSTNQWSATTLSNAATDLYTATMLADKIYFAGGNNNRIIDIYDNATNSWSTSNLQVQWDITPTAYWHLTANPFVSFAAGGNIYWVGRVDEGIFNVRGECDNVYTGRLEMRNAVSGATTIKCAPYFFSQHVEYRNDEIAFFPSYNSYRNRSRRYTGWGTDAQFIIYNTTTGNWSSILTNISGFITFGQDAGAISANNTIYMGGGSEIYGDCIRLTDKVYTISW